MIGKRFLQAMITAIDPKGGAEEKIPRPFLLAKSVVEYLFRLVGFFLLICLTAGLTLSACTQNPFLQALPLVLATAFFFYIAVTTVGIPVFVTISEISNVLVRRLIGYFTIAVMLLATFYSVLESPIFDILLAYVSKLFPAAYECTGGILELGDDGAD